MLYLIHYHTVTFCCQSFWFGVHAYWLCIIYHYWRSASKFTYWVFERSWSLKNYIYVQECMKGHYFLFHLFDSFWEGPPSAFMLPGKLHPWPQKLLVCLLLEAHYPWWRLVGLACFLLLLCWFCLLLLSRFVPFVLFNKVVVYSLLSKKKKKIHVPHV